MKFGSIHTVDAVLDHDHRVISDIGRGRCRQHAGIGIHAGDQKGVDAVRAQQEIEIGAEETVVPFLGVDDEITRDPATAASPCSRVHR